MTAELSLKHDIENLEIIIGFCADMDELIKEHGSSEEAFRGKRFNIVQFSF